MPVLTSHRNQSPNLQHKSIDWVQQKKNNDMKMDKNNRISKQACLYLSVQGLVECCSEVIVVL